MPSLKLYIDNSIPEAQRRRVIDQVKQRFAELPEDIGDDAVLAVIECEVVRGKNANLYWLEVKASVETTEREVVLMANHFTPIVDVEAYEPSTGLFVFREKDSKKLRTLHKEAGEL